MWFERVTLKPGSHGPPVAALRWTLCRLGYLSASEAAGAAPFDAVLGDAVRRFQAEQGLVPDGVVGTATWQKLLSLTCAGSTTPARGSTASSPWFRPGETAVHIHVSVPSRRLRLHMWTSDGEHTGWRVADFPVAVGRPATPTRPGVYTVAQLVPLPGPPLGSRWIRLQPSGSIHGAHDPWRVGQASTCGCVQMYNKDVEFVFHRLAPGTPVVIE